MKHIRNSRKTNKKEPQCIWLRWTTWIGIGRYETCRGETGEGKPPKICPYCSIPICEVWKYEEEHMNKEKNKNSP